jgi:glycine cleavage system H protein
MDPMSDVPANLKYTKDHEWARTEPGSAGVGVTVGITAFAVEQLGDVTLVNLDVKVGDTVTEGKAFGTIESVKTLSDLFAPVTGKILEINSDLETKPELVNEDCYGKGWMVVIGPSDPGALGGLMDEKAYGELLKSTAH